VTTITYCPDTYRVTIADGQTWDYWERNLRFKTDSSAIGPDKGVPALFGAGMQGDRASVIFSTPEEISVFIKRKCWQLDAGRCVGAAAAGAAVQVIAKEVGKWIVEEFSHF
jgi:hypothetical protein